MASKNSVVVSPLLNRIQKQEPLTLKNLAYHIPRVRAGKAASEELGSKKDLSLEEYRKLHKAVTEGEQSKLTLVEMALPLVNTIARNEYQRRSAWNSRVTLDDMMQEGTGGFLRGIEAYNIEGAQTSPTNYLGQWILSDIRRHVESLDHDFSIPHETIERHRKIRAIRSRLFNELNRYPTDQEIIDHANNKQYQPVNKMGKLNKASHTGKLLTLKNVNEEREFSASTGRLESITLTDENDGEYERKANPLNGGDEPSTTTGVEERSARNALSSFFLGVFNQMGIGTIQKDIISQKFGLPPYVDEIPLVGIAKNTHISKYKVNQVISAFAAEMSNRGSIFHREVCKLPLDEVDSLGLGWVLSIIGEYGKRGEPNAVAPLLIQEMKAVPRKPKTKMGEENRGIAYRYIAYYKCELQHITEKRLFVPRNDQKNAGKCESCGSITQWIETLDNPEIVGA